MTKFKGTLSLKQTFAINDTTYRSDSNGCFFTQDPVIIDFLEKNPYWEKVTQEKKSENKAV